MMLVPVDWGISEKLIIFSVARRRSKGKKMPMGCWYPSIYLSLFLPCRGIHHHNPLVLPYSFWSYIIFLCPTAFWSLSWAFVFVTFSLFFFFLPSPVLLRYLTGLWASVSINFKLSSFLLCHTFLLSAAILRFPISDVGLDGNSMSIAMFISVGVWALGQSM